ncbi:antitoxin [Dactylosporangium roseum]|uniref:Antitoxin n=1 Tax=Dactylosporangium roseum TaxID=47989 RepID=A0ABY5YVJ7_9ACTN|nr:antitoxin [Dactylosporangium roseum]UWZ33770.1 antitoxin [Dactylosporangium roseum]
MNSFFDKVKDLADKHDEKVDQALEKIGEEADKRTGGKYADQIAKGVDAAQEHTGEGDTTRNA